ncbi:hypothetical protein [Flavobacterium sp.]|uniref:hypothetical protein n=1 Tax=Flavobacterium sp. TaxID=239 RepID=UPI00403346EF
MPKDAMTKEVTLTFKVKAGDPFEMKKKVAILEKFSRLDMDDQTRIETIIDSPEARKGLMEHWNTLKGFIGLK